MACLIANLVTSISLLLMLVVELTPTSQAQTYTVLHGFTGGADGAAPTNVTRDSAGDLYGTTLRGGIDGGCGNNGFCGTVFRLKRAGSGWIFSPVYDFKGGADGGIPVGVIIGPDGSLYGATATFGPYCDDKNCGSVFNLRPPATACHTALCGWTHTVLHQFGGRTDGENPLGIVFDPLGNIYGTTTGEGPGGFGDIFELTPSNGGWTISVLYSFSLSDGNEDPNSGVILDHSGNLYGTAAGGYLYPYGSVYELSPSGSGWVKSVLYGFQGGSDGRDTYGGLIFDQSGNLYGTTSYGGSGGGGTAFELTPFTGNWNFSLLYSFSGGAYGSDGLTMDAAGNLYGMMKNNGAYGYGTVFKLTHFDGGWTYTSLHDFTGGTDGAYPVGKVIFDAKGNLYGTATAGGSSSNCSGGCGVIFEITP